MPMHHKREQAIAWTVGLWELAKQHGDRVALENPVSVIFQHLNAPVCYVQPYEHGHGETKKTGFALHNLEPLKPTNLVDGREQRIWKMPPSPTRKRDRSQTFDGIAQAVVMQWANVLDAAHHVVNDYPGGAQSLAPRMGKAASSLSHETTGSGTAKLGLLDAVKITQLTGDNRILHAYAQACNALVIPLAAPNSDTPDHVFERMAQVAKEFSDVITAVSHAAADGRVTGNELATVEREWGELVQVGASLMGMLQAMHAACVPKGMAV